MHLLAPIWLIALVAVSIPVVIHLWQIRQGKTLKVGSIAFFSESSPKSTRSFKLSDVLLLLLRCLLLILLALLLASPFLQHRVDKAKSSGWILIPNTNFKETYRKFKPAIDSLKQKGYQLHNFGPGFKKTDTTSNVGDSISINYWHLLNQFTDTLSPGTSVELFVPNNLGYFGDNKPQTNLNIRWHTYIAADSVKKWIAGAWLTTEGNVRVVQGIASPTGISYQYDDLKNGQEGAGYDLTIDNGIPVINLKTSASEKVKVDTSTARIAVYTDKNDIDAGYLKAALYAITELTKRKTVIRQFNQINEIPMGQDWIFWLSDKPVDNSITQKTKNLFSYAAGKNSDISSWLIKGAGNTKIDLYKDIKPQSPTGEPVWVDGFGKPVLSVIRGKFNSYQFYIHFNPAWNDLVWSDEFPKWLLELTLKQLPYADKYEQRMIDIAQLQTRHISNQAIKKQVENTKTDLTRYLWLMLAIVFFAERWLATKNNKVTVNG